MMRMLLLLAFLPAVLGAAPAGAEDAPPAGERRVALLIGNNAYRHIGELSNPVNDVEAMAEVLQNQGFYLIGGGPLTDVGHDEMELALRELGAALKGPDTIGFFMYSGHGLSIKETSYLIPIDAEPSSEWQAEEQLIAANRVVNLMGRAGNRLNMIVLDACRNVVFPVAAEEPAESGLAEMQTVGGMLISYATQPGNTASDGLAGAHSPYAQALLDIVQTPGLNFVEAFNQVGLQVKRQTAGVQQPWLALSPIEGSFVFQPEGVAALALASMTEAPRPAIETLQDCPHCPPVVPLSGGRFQMGSAYGDPDERPVHEVAVAPFALGQYEVTFAEWDACVAAGGCARRPDDLGWGRDDRPVMDVSWADAEGYATWLSAATGQRYRLPTEAEWEYAARAGSTADDVPVTGRINCALCGSRWDGRKTAPVGSFNPNAFGLHDMLGNVWEWTADCAGPGYADAPIDGSAAGTADCPLRSVRGGSWGDRYSLVRAANRGGLEPDGRNGAVGFRIVRETPPDAAGQVQQMSMP